MSVTKTCRWKPATGKSINVEFVSNVYQVNGGKVIQCNIRDITKRKQADHLADPAIGGIALHLP